MYVWDVSRGLCHMPVPLVDTAITTVQTAPAPLWRGVSAIVLQCDGDRGLCEQLADRAQRGAPLPVVTVPEATTISTLRVIAAFGPADAPLSLTLAADRPVPMDDAQGARLPRRFVMAAGEAVPQFFDRALDAVLPWRSRRGPGRIMQLPKGEVLR